jgi:UDP-glucose:(heptosyl)LPS alpha-1,3-glucosyltransferase
MKYLWWLFANHVQRWRDRRFGRANTDLTYSPGINCLDADVIVVHIVFHELFSRVSSELLLRQLPLRAWHLVIHRKLYYKLAMLLERKVYKDPRVRLAAVSNLVARHLKTHFDRTDVTVIPNAVDSLRFTPEERFSRREATRQRFKYSDEDFVLLLIGNDWKNKGLIPLLRAFALLRDLPLQLLVVGADDSRFYEPWVAKLATPGRMRFEAPSIDVLTFYAAADAYVGPSLADAFGLPIVEAMACGLPVIASIQAGASELIRDGETGLLLYDPRDPSEIARLIEKLYRSVTLRREMGLAASEYVQTNCGWDQNVSKTRDFLETVLRERQPRATSHFT